MCRIGDEIIHVFANYLNDGFFLLRYYLNLQGLLSEATYRNS